MVSGRLSLVLAWAIGSTALCATENGGVVRSPRNANYTIDVTLDPASKLLTGRQIVEWTNLGDAPTDELWFHLYWNGWRNSRSTWMLEDELRGRSELGDSIAEDDWSYLEVEAMRTAAADLTAGLRFESPDDGNPDDRTVLVATLPEPVPPATTLEIEVEWRAKVPRTFARTGFRGDYFFIAHWFPKLGVYRGDRWHCHQFHAGTEFFSDYGVYDVSITLPERFVLGATGRLVEKRDNGDGTVTHRHRQEDVHGFAWTASPDYVVIEDRFEESGLPAIDIRLLMQPEHLGQTQRHLTATKAAFKQYGTWFGPYEYGHVTVVDPAYGSGAGGMEYPTLFTCGTRLFNPFGGGSPEGVTIHEAGHQFWYGIVGNDEFEHAWLDEGLNTFSTARTARVTYGESLLSHRFFQPPGTEQRGFLPVLLPGFSYLGKPLGARLDRYRGDATSDAQSTPTYLYHPGSGSSLSYSKTALWLGTLENHLGWSTLQRILSTFFERWRFRHPTPEDFFAVASEVSGEDLRWFFAQVFSSEAFDYGVQSVASEPSVVEGWTGTGDRLTVASGESTDDTAVVYRTEVIVRRYGGGVFPIDVLLVFDDGSEVRRRWDGRARWQRFVEERPAKLRYAEVDPDRVLLLDLSPTNNSRRLEANNRFPTIKWSLKWMAWLQDFLATFTFFV